MNVGDDHVWLDHDGVIRETEKAKCFSIENEDVWIPISQIEDENDELVAVSKWFAEQRGLEGTW
jgi:hypothetical protein